MKITLEFEERAFASLRRGPDEFARKLHLAACVKWCELGRIAQAKTAELAGLSRTEFLDVLRAMGTPAVQTSIRELAAEIE